MALPQGNTHMRCIRLSVRPVASDTLNTFKMIIKTGLRNEAAQRVSTNSQLQNVICLPFIKKIPPSLYFELRRCRVHLAQAAPYSSYT